MKGIQNSRPSFLRITCLIIALSQIGFIGYSQNEGQWRLKGDAESRVLTSSFAEDTDGNVLIRSFKIVPPGSLVDLDLDYSSFTCIKENVISIYTPSGEWITHRKVAKKLGIHTDNGFIPFARYNISKNEKVFEVRYSNEGQLWMLTTKGLLFCNNNQHIRLLEDINFEKELSEVYNSVLGIAGTPEFINNYVVTENKIFYYADYRFDLIHQMNKKEEIYSAVEGTDDNVWILTSNGILKCNNGIITKYFEELDFGLHPRFDGFVLSYNAIYKYENDEFVKIKEVSEDEKYQLINTDREGRTWFVKKDASVSYDGDEITNEMLSSVSFYLEGSWREIGPPIVNRGLYRWPPDDQLYFRPDGKVWINGGRFIACFDGDSTKVLPIQSEEISTHSLFHTLCFDHTGNVYISCDYNNRLHLDSYNQIGVGHALLKFTGEEAEILHPSVFSAIDGKLSTTRITEMLVDKRNNLWLLTVRHGSIISVTDASVNARSFIAKISEEGIEVFDKKDGIKQKLSKQQIYEDSKGRIWIGSFMQGVVMYEYN